MKEESDPISSSVATGTEFLRTELLACNPRVRIAQNTSEKRKKGTESGLKRTVLRFPASDSDVT